MLRVNTYLDKSLIHGFGVFASQEIKKGDIVWRFVPEIDRVIEYSFSTFLNYTEMDKEFIDTYAYYDMQLDKWILSADNDRFTNHSETPNTIAIDNGEVVACEDISIGDEITINYYDIDKWAESKLR